MPLWAFSSPASSLDSVGKPVAGSFLDCLGENMSYAIVAVVYFILGVLVSLVLLPGKRPRSNTYHDDIPVKESRIRQLFRRFVFIRRAKNIERYLRRHEGGTPLEIYENNRNFVEWIDDKNYPALASFNGLIVLRDNFPGGEVPFDAVW